MFILFFFILSIFLSSTASRLHKLDLSTFVAAILGIFPAVNTERHPKQAASKKQKYQTHHPHKAAIFLFGDISCLSIASYAVSIIRVGLSFGRYDDCLLILWLIAVMGLLSVIGLILICVSSIIVVVGLIVEVIG